MATLLDELPSLARIRCSRSAVRARQVDGAWAHLCWAELDALASRVAATLADEAPRGARVRWSACPAAANAVDLALLHMGVVGERVDADATLTVDETRLADVSARREEPTRLVRLRADLRASDPAAVRCGRMIDHAAVVRHARRAAHALDGVSEVLVSGPAMLRQSVGWGALVGGYGQVLGGPELLAVAEPDAWVCTPESLAALGLARSRIGPLGAAARAWSASSARLGPRLKRVLVLGSAAPDMVAALRDRGIHVGAWIAEEA